MIITTYLPLNVNPRELKGRNRTKIKGDLMGKNLFLDMKRYPWSKKKKPTIIGEITDVNFVVEGKKEVVELKITVDDRRKRIVKKMMKEENLSSYSIGTVENNGRVVSDNL